jgi:adenosylcobyric acid synthase
MHMGVTTGPDRARPMVDFGDRDDGARSADGRVLGCYLHGLFADDGFRHGFLARLADRGASGVAFDHQVDQALDAIASGLDSCLDLDRLWEIADGP